MFVLDTNASIASQEKLSMPQLKNFKAFLFDVDQTLTNSSREISPRTKAALKALTEHGFIWGVCTGKNYSRLRDENISSLLPPGSLHIVAGGAQIIDQEGNSLWEKFLPAQDVSDLYELAQKYQAGFAIKAGPVIYLNQTAFKISDRPAVPINPEILKVPALGVVVINPPPLLQEQLKQIPNICLKTNQIQNVLFFDINAPGVNKATALIKWCELNQLEPKQVIGVGDSDNDLEFLQTVGHGVAMGNATAEIKAIADQVIGPTDEAGLAIYLEAVLKNNIV